jgi:hypothetical protein
MRRVCRCLVKPFCLLMVLSLVLLDLEVQSARAGMIGTETVLSTQADQSARLRVAAFFEREDVAAALMEHGVPPEEARERVASLSDTEVMQIAQVVDQLPAGGNSVVGAVLFIFLVLLITDILGFTRIFPFVRPVR